MADHKWILDVYDDINEYAKNNNLRDIALSIADIRHVAETEINAATSVNQQETMFGAESATLQNPLSALTRH